MSQKLNWLHAPASHSKTAYVFEGAHGRVSWPMQNGQNLAGAGLWNFLWRLGINPKLSENVGEGHVILALDGPLNPNDVLLLRKQLATGNNVIVATGNPLIMQDLLPEGVTISCEKSPYPSAALGWTGVGSLKDQIVSPPGWDFFRIRTSTPEVKSIGEMIVFGGERENPKRALRTTLDAPAALKCGNLVLLNGNPFAALQSWLQGQEDLSPWRLWRHSLFWLDEQVEAIADALESIGLPLNNIPAPGISGLPETTIVIRHDLDSSRDTSMLEASLLAGTGASHAILLDENTDFWTQILNSAEKQEAAFHFDTIQPDTVLERIRRHTGWHPVTEYRPARSTIVGNGLLRQVKAARSRGIDAYTLHRHASFIIYPELVDALDNVFTQLPDVLGASSFFRGQILRWGIDRVDGANGTLQDLFPFWLPFRLAHAGYNGRLTKGLETTSIMEIEPSMVCQMLEYRSRRLKQRVLTLSYHPFHAQRPSFNLEGTLPWFKQILEIMRDRNIPVMSLNQVMEKCERQIL